MHLLIAIPTALSGWPFAFSRNGPNTALDATTQQRPPRRYFLRATIGESFASAGSFLFSVHSVVPKL